MRVALLSDIHGNLTAFEAALADLASQPADRLVCLGDVAATGPQPREVLQRLRALGCPVVMGNCDQMLLDLHMAPPPPPTNEPVSLIDEVDRWYAARLSEDEAAFIHTFQPTVSVDLGAGRTLLCYHGSPRSFHDLVQPFTSDDELAEYFAGQQAAICAGGHTHNQMLRRYGSSMLINPGSVGLPFDRYPPHQPVYNAAWAEYAVVTCEGSHLNIELRRVSYDFATLARAARASGMPRADEWLADWASA